MKHKTITLSPYYLNPERDHVLGHPQAAVQLLEYGDFQCPYCARAYFRIDEIRNEFGADLCYSFRNFPLSKHEYAEIAAEGAGERSAYWQFHDALFRNQEVLSEEAIADLVDQLGFDRHRFFRELETGKYRGRIEEDLQLATRAGVDGTPIFFVNGQRYDDDLSVEGILSAANVER